MSCCEKGAILPESAIAFALTIVTMSIVAVLLISAFQSREEKARDAVGGAGYCRNCEPNCDPEICP